MPEKLARKPSLYDENLAKREEGTFLDSVVESLRKNPQVFMPLIVTNITDWKPDLPSYTQILVAPVLATADPNQLNEFAANIQSDFPIEKPFFTEIAKIYGNKKDKFSCADHRYKETHQSGERVIRLIYYPNSRLAIEQQGAFNEAVRENRASIHYFKSNFDLTAVGFRTLLSNSWLGALERKISQNPQVYEVYIPNPDKYTGGL